MYYAASASSPGGGRARLYNVAGGDSAILALVKEVGLEAITHQLRSSSGVRDFGVADDAGADLASLC
jgi:hypothetical protein